MTSGLQLKSGTMVDATLIEAPRSAKNNRGDRYPEMHQTNKGDQWYVRMKGTLGSTRTRVLCTAWCVQRPTTPKDKRSRSRRASGPRSNPVPGTEAPVRAREGALSRAAQEHGAATHAVCAVQSLDSASACCYKVARRGEIVQQPTYGRPMLPSSEIAHDNSRACRCCADFPY